MHCSDVDRTRGAKELIDRRLFKRANGKYFCAQCLWKFSRAPDAGVSEIEDLARADLSERDVPSGARLYKYARGAN